MFHVLDQFVILPRSAEREKKLLLAGLRDDRWYAEGGVISKEIRRIFQSRRDH